MSNDAKTIATLSLARTAEAIRVYDGYNTTFDSNARVDKCLQWFDGLKLLGMAVGQAFGLDTADRNSMDTCKQCVRPDKWLRDIVGKWEDSVK